MGDMSRESGEHRNYFRKKRGDRTCNILSKVKQEDTIFVSFQKILYAQKLSHLELCVSTLSFEHLCLIRCFNAHALHYGLSQA